MAAERTGRIIVTHAVSSEVKEYISVTQSAKLTDTDPVQPTGSSATDPAKPTESMATDPTQPTRSSTVTPAQPTESSTVTPIRPTESSATDPAKPTESLATDPAQPTRSSTVTPAQPTESSTVTPIRPTESTAADPTQPTGSSATDPIQSTGSSATDPTQPTGSSATDPAKPTESSAADPTQPTGSIATDPTQPTGSSEAAPTSPSSNGKDPARTDTITTDISEITANANGVLSASFVQVDTQGTGGFQADTGNSSWLKIGKSNKKASAAEQLSYDESGIVFVFVDTYTGKSSRTGTIVFQHENGTSAVQVSVVQSALKTVFTIDTEKKTAEKDGSFYNNAVSVKTGNASSYTVEVKECDWLGITAEDTSDFDMGLEKMSFTGSQTFYLVAAENTGSKRSAVITVTQEGGGQKEITVVQMGTDGAYMELDRETAYFDGPEAAASGIVHVLTDEDTKWTAEASKKWIKISDSQDLSAKKYASMDGTGSGGFYIHVNKNNSFQERDGYVTVSAPGMEDFQIYVSQAENERDLAVLLEELTVSVSQKTFKKGKTTKIKFTYPEGLYASDIQKVSYKSSNKKVASVDKKGKIKALRKGKSVITVKVRLENGASRTFKLKVVIGNRKVKITNKK